MTILYPTPYTLKTRGLCEGGGVIALVGSVLLRAYAGRHLLCYGFWLQHSLPLWMRGLLWFKTVIA